MLARDGGMNVPNISQGPGSVTTLPRTAFGAETSAARLDAAVVGPASSKAPSAAISFTRLACFDVNGDGNIDTRSAATGGDATLLVPTHAVDLPTYSRPAHPIGGGHLDRDKPSGSDPAPAVATPNAAQANRAADAYERYGQSVPIARATPAPTPVSATPIR
jgi:hypothetical protein